MSSKMHKILIGAGGFAVLFYLARRGYLGATAQDYAIKASTSAIVTGINF